MSSDRTVYDVVVIGGGINGVGIALDAAGRGLSVQLCEMGDLGSSTSSNSSKLIHGGLRYLEYYEFRLVREALAEREVLLSKAPHIMSPLRFRLPHRPHLRPAWMIRLGLFLYDHLAKRVSLPSSKGIKFQADDPLIEEIKRGFEYSDGWVDDSRLVILNAMGAKHKGAQIKTRHRCVKAERKDGMWEVEIENQLTGEKEVVNARLLVNAAGPWVSSLFQSALKVQAPKKICLVKGSHIIVPKIHSGKEAYILQNEDGRVVFVTPFEDEYSLVGTTDVVHHGDPLEAKISQEETEYLISVVNGHFKNKISVADIVHTYSGVRPLLDDEADSPQAVTRDYTFEIESDEGKAPLLSVFGGKITTYRKLAEVAVDKIAEFFPRAGSPWTADVPLPGGDFKNRSQLTKELEAKYPWLPNPQAQRYVRSYGTLAHSFLADARSLDDLGEHFGAGLYAREVDYLIDQEWAVTLPDIIWRRSKLGLELTQTEQTGLKQYLKKRNLDNYSPQQCAG